VRFLASEVLLYVDGKTIFSELPVYRATSLIKNSPPLEDHHRALGIDLL